MGFRSAFMFHNLEWLKELNVLYDASTFDTDPFEPQPDGANTIFPFWVGRSDGSGYVELPYTLPQDSTLFLVLGEKTNDIWKRKLDWVARHGRTGTRQRASGLHGVWGTGRSRGVSGDSVQRVSRPRLCTVRRCCLVCTAARRRSICEGVVGRAGTPSETAKLFAEEVL